MTEILLIFPQMEKVAVGGGRFQWSVCLVLLLQAAGEDVCRAGRVLSAW